MGLLDDGIKIDITQEEYGFGYDALRFNTTGNTALSDDSRKQLKTTPNYVVSYEIKFISQIEDITKNFSANVEAQGALFGVNVGASAGFVSETSFAANRSYLVANVDVQTSSTFIEKALIDKEYLPDGSTKSILDFYAKFGTHYIASIVSGGKLVLFIEIESQDIGSKLKFDSSVKVPQGTFSGSASFSAALSKTLGNQRLTIRGFNIGGKSLPKEAKEDLQAAIDFALGFDELVQSNPDVYQAVLTPYFRVPNAPANMQSLLFGPAANVESLSTCLQQYTDQLSLISYADPGDNVLGLPDSSVKTLFDLKGKLKDDRDRVLKAWNQEDPQDIVSADTLISKGIIKPASWYASQIQVLNIQKIPPVVRFGDVLAISFNGNLANTISFNPKDPDAPYLGGDIAGFEALKLTDASNEKSNNKVKLDTIIFVDRDNDQLSSSDKKDFRLKQDTSSTASWDEPKTKDNTRGLPEESWKIKRLSAQPSGIKDDYIRYGDSVAFVSQFFDGQELRDKGTKLTTAKPSGNDHYNWTLNQSRQDG